MKKILVSSEKLSVHNELIAEQKLRTKELFEVILKIKHLMMISDINDSEIIHRVCDLERDIENLVNYFDGLESGLNEVVNDTEETSRKVEIILQEAIETAKNVSSKFGFDDSL